MKAYVMFPTNFVHPRVCFNVANEINVATFFNVFDVYVAA